MMTRKSMFLLQRWLDAVCSRNVEHVLALYTSDAVLLGTFAKEIEQGPELRSYFRDFLKKMDLCGQVDSVIEQEAEGSLILSGEYTFHWLDNTGPRAEEARYTFVFVPVGEEWLILTQHSSAVPG
jgi:hypothetical protein